MVLDLATLLVSSGLRVAEQLILRWVKAGRSEVKVSEVNESIAREAQEEANRLRLRVDDLERETKRMMDQIVAASPELSYAKPRLRSKLTIDYNPRDPESSKELLAALHTRVQALMPTASKPEGLSRDAGASEVDAESGDADVPTGGIEVREGNWAPPGRSQQMLEELQERIRSRESNRK